MAPLKAKKEGVGVGVAGLCIHSSIFPQRAESAALWCPQTENGRVIALPGPHSAA